MSKKGKAEGLKIDGALKMKDDIIEETIEFQTKDRLNTQYTYSSVVANEGRSSLIKQQNPNNRYITFILGLEKHKVDAIVVFNACPLISKNESVHKQIEVYN